MKITLGAKELENIVGSWATDRYDAGVPSVKIVKRRDSIDVIIDYTDAVVAGNEDDAIADSEYDNEQLAGMNNLDSEEA